MEQARKPVKPKQLLLNGYAEQEADGTWFAICLELNLYARGDSYDHVRMKLHALVNDYVRDALTVDREYAADLLLRPAPAYFWLRYFFIRCLVFVRAVTSARRFKELLPLIPA